MRPRRLTTAAAELCQTVVLAAWTVVLVAGFGPTSIETIGAAPKIVDRQPTLAHSVEAVAAPQAMATTTTTTTTTTESASTDKATVTELAAAAGPMPVVVQRESVAEAAPSDPSPVPQQSEVQPLQVASANPNDSVVDDRKADADSIQIREECLVVDVCIDRYLWALYQRTPKEDTIKEEERRKVTVRKKGKKIRVTRTFVKLIDEDFAWKDPKAAERAGMSMMDYVIGGMDKVFKLRLFHVLYAAQEAGLSPGITSAFRDDYRQSIATGLRAATDRSYHGGSFRGGYGHGLAADIVSVKGETRAQRLMSTQVLWKWVDAHGAEFGVGRPYLDRDPPHLAPIDGKEYADHRGIKPQDAAPDLRKRRWLAADYHS